MFDTVCAIVRRAISGRPIAQADDGHLHHQLVRVGLSQRQAVLLLYSVGGCAGAGRCGALARLPLQAFIVAAGLARRRCRRPAVLGVLGECSADASPAHAAQAVRGRSGGASGNCRPVRPGCQALHARQWLADRRYVFSQETANFQGIAN